MTLRRVSRKPFGAAVLLCVSSALIPGQDLAEQARRLRPADVESGGRAVLDNIARRARSALDAIPRATTAPQADAARPRLRRQLTDSLGYKRLPWPPDLQARITGTVRRESYHIEKVVFQSLPGDLVPAHLYVPDHIVGTAPAVLFYNGHW